MTTTAYPRRLIEVDLPIKRISAMPAARRASGIVISAHCISGGRAVRWLRVVP
jgi:hypothetical protein